MPSYTAYKRQVMDADDNITWITMKGNHIPIKEGQTKEEAVKEFLAKKGEGSAKHGSGSYIKVKGASQMGSIPDNVAEKHIKTVKEKTIGEMEKAGENVSHLKQAMQHVHYGFYEERGKKMTPTQFKEFLKSEQEKNAGKNDYYANRTKQRYPEAEKLANKGESSAPESKTIQSDLGKFADTYNKLYKDKDSFEYNPSDLDKEYNKAMHNNKFKQWVQSMVKERGDVFASDRELHALLIVAKEKGLIPQENKPAKKKETLSDVFEKYKSTSINNHAEWDANREKMQKAINKEYTVENVQNWTAEREGISFGGSDYGEYGTNTKLTVSKNLKDLLLSLPEHKQKDVIGFIRVHSGRPYSSEHIDPYEFMKALKNGKESNGKTTIDIETTTYGWFDD